IQSATTLIYDSHLRPPFAPPPRTIEHKLVVWNWPSVAHGRRMRSNSSLSNCRKRIGRQSRLAIASSKKRRQLTGNRDTVDLTKLPGRFVSGSEPVNFLMATVSDRFARGVCAPCALVNTQGGELFALIDRSDRGKVRAFGIVHTFPTIPLIAADCQCADFG